MTFNPDAIADSLKIELNKAIMLRIAQEPTVDIHAFLGTDNPTRSINLDELSTEDVKEYLLSLHTTLWQSWIITDRSGMEKATSWVQEFLDKLYRFQSDKQDRLNQFGDRDLLKG